MKATVFSPYMANISPEVVILQKECVERFLPEGWDFYQIEHKKTHHEILAQCVKENTSEISIFLDIDCIPLSYQSFTYLLDKRWGVEQGSLMGAAQRANHIRNNNHIYVGPFCMAFKNSSYNNLGNPTFQETYRGDVGEELTYAWEKANKPVYFLWPSEVEKPAWNLIDDVCRFGLGTTYEGLFYHAFCIREGNQKAFIEKCMRVLDREKQALAEKEEVIQ